MLKDLLPDWTDFDGAEHAIAVCLGLMPADWRWVLDNDVKGFFWSNNPIGNTLHDVIEKLVTLGILEQNEDAQFRYNRRFTPPWDVKLDEKGCPVCRERGLVGGSIVNVAVSVRRGATLRFCESCGTYWDQFRRNCFRISREEAEQAYKIKLPGG